MVKTLEASLLKDFKITADFKTSIKGNIDEVQPCIAEYTKAIVQWQKSLDDKVKDS